MSKSAKIQNFIEEATGEFTLQDILKEHDVSTALVNNVLKSEVSKGTIKAVKRGKSTVYLKLSSEGGTCLNTPKRMDIPVSQRFQFIEEFTKMVAKGTIPSLLLTGSPGTGKTHTVLSTLEKCGLEENEDFIVVKGHTSALGLYRMLYFNLNKLIVMDDADSAWNCNISLNILKGALDSYAKRTISWRSLAAERNDLPESFDFEGSIIFISNKDANRLDSAVVNRTITANLLMSRSEMIDRMEDVIIDIEKSVPIEMKREVIGFLRDNHHHFDTLSLRTFIQSCRIRAGGNNNWKNMILWTVK